TDVVESASDPHMSGRIGWRLPLGVGAHGKVLENGEELGLDDEEYLEGVRAAAAPIVDADGRKVAVLIVVGFKSRLPLGRLRQVARLVAARAAEVSAKLAGRAACSAAPARRGSSSRRKRCSTAIRDPIEPRWPRPSAATFAAAPATPRSTRRSVAPRPRPGRNERPLGHRTPAAESECVGASHR